MIVNITPKASKSLVWVGDRVLPRYLVNAQQRHQDVAKYTYKNQAWQAALAMATMQLGLTKIPLGGSYSKVGRLAENLLLTNNFWYAPPEPLISNFWKFWRNHEC